MSQITIRNMPAPVETEIRKLAAEKDISLSAAAAMLLERALGIDPAAEKKRDLSGLFGTWTEADFTEFRNATTGLDRIDEELWR